MSARACNQREIYQSPACIYRERERSINRRHVYTKQAASFRVLRGVLLAEGLKAAAEELLHVPQHLLVREGPARVDEVPVLIDEHRADDPPRMVPLSTQNSSFFDTKFIILNANSPTFDTKFII